jgi:hypothetical protein
LKNPNSWGRLRRLLSFGLALGLLLLGVTASATTYKPIIDLSLHGNLTFTISQNSQLIEEAYEYDLDYNFVLGNLQANKPISLNLTSGDKSSRWMNPIPTSNCALKVGIGLASGRVLEQDPARWLGEIPLQISWESKVLDVFTLHYWRASASGEVDGPSSADVGVNDELVFHVACDGVVLDAFQFTFAGGVKELPAPVITLKNNLVTVDLGKSSSADYLQEVQLAFYECENETSGCREFGDVKNYPFRGLITEPLEFQVTGLTGPYFNVWVGMANYYGAWGAFSNSIRVAGTNTKKYNVPIFKGTATNLTTTQKSLITTEIAKFAGLKTATCYGYVLSSQSLQDKTRAKTRAKNACFYVKANTKNVAVTYKTTVTKVKSNLGKVLLQLSN